MRYAELFGLNIIIARVGVAFGPWEYDTGVRDPISVHMDLARKAFAGQPAVLPRDPSKDWVYSRDVAAALEALLVAPKLKSSVFNISGSEVSSAGDFAQTLSNAVPGFTWSVGGEGLNANIDLHGAKDRPPLDTQRLRSEVGFVSQFNRERMFVNYIDWLRRFKFWRKSLGGRSL